MKMRALLVMLLAAGALASGGYQWWQARAAARLWQQAAPLQQRQMLYLEFGPAIDRVSAQVPRQDGLVLIAGVDPALLPYYLHPRPLWQTRPEPETDRVYMDLPPAAYPLRAPSELPGPWLLVLDPGNLPRGGELSRLRGD